MQNNEVWVKSNNDWINGIFIGKENNMYKISINNEIILIDNIEIKNDDSIDNVDNLINIPHLNEPSILNSIQIRYFQNKIYTYTGKILISINPFTNLGIYNKEIINNYLLNDNLTPHIYQISKKSLIELSRFNQNQSILVSGESGAGKTHATKLMLEFLTSVCSNSDNIGIEKKIILSNPILEAFGNAKTIRNDNSSRFGKFIKLNFNDNNKIIGAKIETYLLEKIRLIYQNNNERNFHIFYLLINGMNYQDKSKYKLNNSFKYLNNGLLERNDKKQYNELVEAFNIMNFSEDEINIILNFTSAILNLGNINFDDDGNILNYDQLIIVSELLNINQEILEFALCYKEVKAVNEIYKIKLKKDECIHARDSFAMKYYQDIFNYIVKLINRTLNETNNKFIGILDIFGFESIQINSFEQLCINYTNERLQNQFNKYIFKLEQEEYIKENINWNSVSFPDNKECLNLIDGKYGILNMLDEECRLPKGTDKNFTLKLNKKFNNNENYILKKRYIDLKFGINHYAGEVTYDTIKFCEKNKDAVSNEIINCIKSIPIKISEIQNTNLSSIKTKSLSYQFKTQLNKLLNLIDSTQTHYVRCIKPNDLNIPNKFNRIKIIEQLKYCGVLEAVKVARAGYAVRMLHYDFIKRYKIIKEINSLDDLSKLDFLY